MDSSAVALAGTQRDKWANNSIKQFVFNAPVNLQTPRAKYHSRKSFRTHLEEQKIETREKMPSSENFTSRKWGEPLQSKCNTLGALSHGTVLLATLLMLLLRTEKWLSVNGQIKNSQEINKKDVAIFFFTRFHFFHSRRWTFAIYLFLRCTWRNYYAHKKIFIILGARSSSKLST